MSELLHQRLTDAALRAPDAQALVHGMEALNYAELAQQVQCMAALLVEHGLDRSERVAVFLEKRFENVIAMFGAAAAGAVFVPVNPLLRAEQVAHILSDCGATMLVTSAARLAMLDDALAACASLISIFLVDAPVTENLHGVAVLSLPEARAAQPQRPSHRVIDSDMAAILYTSGSTGKPKGVVLSHRNLVAGAASVCSYLENTAEDRILSVLPLSFDYGLSQLTTAFHSGATAVLLNYLGPRDIIDCLREQRITGLAGVPPLWMQLAQQSWGDAQSLRYLTNSGGVMPQRVLGLLREALPHTKIFLMYGLTEAFRSTYLPPEEITRRPDSIGRAIPNAEVLVLRADGTPCADDEPGELVHRGALVALGYWNDVSKTAQRFRPLPQAAGLPLAEIAVWSGDTVRRDRDGFLYFIGRNDDMLKISGYRVSPTEIEEVLTAHADVAEAVAFGVPHPLTGHACVAMVTPKADAFITEAQLQAHCRQHLPPYMTPASILVSDELPRNPNGKFDRKALQQTYCDAELSRSAACAP
jgi:acyl-CoA ligase (AMP-forming) (exosortase A-associated)